MDTDSFVILNKTKDFNEGVSNNVVKWLNTSNYSKADNWSLPIGWNKKVIGPFKDGLGGKIMNDFVALRAKTLAYLMNDDSEHKKAKGTKKMRIKKTASVWKLYRLLIKW